MGRKKEGFGVVSGVSLALYTRREELLFSIENQPKGQEEGSVGFSLR